MERYQILKQQLIQLKLKTIANEFYSTTETFKKNSLNHIDYLAELVSKQFNTKIENSINYRIRSAKFPKFKTIEQFDFSFQKEIDKSKILDLLTFDFIKKTENIIFIGPPGVGKSHLAIAIGIEACKKRIRNVFYTAPDIIKELKIAKISNDLPNFLDRLSRFPLIIIDELGYMPLTTEDANLFFQLIARKYEKTSIIITSNYNFDKWGEIFQDNVVAAAIIDRIIHHSHIFRITGNSYRMKNKLVDKS